MHSNSFFDFLKQLKLNNNREWFLENRRLYEVASKDFKALVQEVIQALQPHDGTLVGIQAKDCVFRINRDVRFSKDKSPYKTNMGAGISREGKKLPVAGYYLHVEPGASFVAVGLYMPQPELLKIIRDEIAYDSAAMDEVFAAASFKQYFKDFDQWGDSLKNVPRGFEPNHPKAEWLKLKSFTVSCPLSDNDFAQPDAVQRVVGPLIAAVPLAFELNKLIGK